MWMKLIWDGHRRVKSLVRTDAKLNLRSRLIAILCLTGSCPIYQNIDKLTKTHLKWWLTEVAFYVMQAMWSYHHGH
jgi:hypothetical protein